MIKQLQFLLLLHDYLFSVEFIPASGSNLLWPGLIDLLESSVQVN